MDIEILRDYCLAKPCVTESTPFGPDPLVMKVCNKMFCLFSISNFVSANLKCDPAEAIELRDSYTAVKPGFHMNKKHWNTVDFNKDVPDDMVLQMVDSSYDLIVKSLPKKVRDAIK